MDDEVEKEDIFTDKKKIRERKKEEHKTENKKSQMNERG